MYNKPYYQAQFKQQPDGCNKGMCITWYNYYIYSPSFESILYMQTQGQS